MRTYNKTYAFVLGIILKISAYLLDRPNNKIAFGILMLLNPIEERLFPYRWN